ncbi:MAG TPA: hypothetical protein VFB28_11630 [Terriglobales bacterium]|nr:hypothetical protein [Terriglobales bacterium]
MNERVRFFEHKGKQILLCDFSYCAADKLPAIVDEIKWQIAQHAPNSVLTLADFTGAEIDKAVATRMKEALAVDRPYVKRSAWVGTESLPKVFYDNFKHFSRREFPTFASREEAMEWLVRENGS